MFVVLWQFTVLFLDKYYYSICLQLLQYMFTTTVYVYNYSICLQHFEAAEVAFDLLKCNNLLCLLYQQEQVLDPKTRLLLYKLVNSEILEEVNGCISTGKEACVFHAFGGR